MRSLVVLACIIAGGVPNGSTLNVGSKPARIQDFPYFASIEIEGVYACAATIVDDKYVMTTKSCVNGVDIKSIGVRVGTSKQGKRGDYYRAIDVSLWHSYQYVGPSPTVEYDIAMVKVAVSFTYYPKVMWANPNADGIQELQEGSVVGWGNTKLGGLLTSANAYVLPRINCSEIYAGVMNVSANMFCLWPSEPTNSPCFADMGAPFYLNEQYYGVVTHSPGCDDPGLPLVVTGVSKFTSFIIMVLCDLDKMFDNSFDLRMATDPDSLRKNMFTSRLMEVQYKNLICLAI